MKVVRVHARTQTQPFSVGTSHGIGMNGFKAEGLLVLAAQSSIVFTEAGHNRLPYMGSHKEEDK
jgi:hypothetical protein